MPDCRREFLRAAAAAAAAGRPGVGGASVSAVVAVTAAQEIELTKQEVDAHVFIEASKRSEAPWAEGDA